MKNTIPLTSGGLYLFKSHSCGNTCFFESKEEIDIFNRLLRIHLKKYVNIHQITIRIDGYQMLVRIKNQRTILTNYQKEREKQGKKVKPDLITEPWRIVSEKMRIIHSVFAKRVNKLRARTGVLVKSRYERQYFENMQEAINYIEGKNKFMEESQNNRKYRAISSHCYVLNWLVYRGKKWLKKSHAIALDQFKLATLINSTILAHKHT